MGKRRIKTPKISRTKKMENNTNMENDENIIEIDPLNTKLPRKCPYCEKQFKNRGGVAGHVRLNKVCRKKLLEDQIDPRSDEFWEMTVIQPGEVDAHIRKAISSKDEEIAKIYKDPNIDNEKKNLTLKELDAKLSKKEKPIEEEKKIRKVPLRLSNKAAEEAEPTTRGAYGTEASKRVTFTGEQLHKGEVLIDHGYGDNMADVVLNAMDFAFDKFLEAHNEKEIDLEDEEIQPGDDPDEKDGGEKMGTIDFSKKPNYMKELIKEVREMKEQQMVNELKTVLTGSAETQNPNSVNMQAIYAKWIESQQQEQMMRNMGLMGGGNNSDPNKDVMRRLEEQNRQLQEQMTKQQNEINIKLLEQQKQTQEMLFQKQKEDEISQLKNQIAAIAQNNNRSTSDEIQRWLAMNKDKDLEMEKMRVDYQQNQQKMLFDELKFLREKVSNYSNSQGMNDPLSETLFEKVREKMLKDFEKGLYDPKAPEEDKNGKIMELIGQTLGSLGPVAQAFIENRNDRKKYEAMQPAMNPAMQQQQMQQEMQQAKMNEQQFQQQYESEQGQGETDPVFFDPSENRSMEQPQSQQPVRHHAHSHMPQVGPVLHPGVAVPGQQYGRPVAHIANNNIQKEQNVDPY